MSTSQAEPMSTVPPQDLRTPTWLTRSGMDQFSVKGELALVGDRIQYSVGAQPGGQPVPKKTVAWLEVASGEPGVGERLERGEAVKVLDVARGDADVKFTNALVTPGIRLRVNGELWRLWFQKPGGLGALGVLFGIGDAVKARRAWRDALRS